MSTPNPFGVIALSDALYVAPDNPHGFVPAIARGPRPTLGQNALAFVEGAADLARGYSCGSLTLWNGFGGSRTNADTGFVLNLLDYAPGITLADVNACSAAIHARGLRAGIGISPVTVFDGANGPRWDASNPEGTLMFEMSLAVANGFDDAYVDSLKGECMAIEPDALACERFAPLVRRFSNSVFLVEFSGPGYRDLAEGRVFQWRDSARTFTHDLPQAVELDAADVKSKAQQAAWGKLLWETRSTVVVNCRPDDPTLPKSQAPVLAAWRASGGH